MDDRKLKKNELRTLRLIEFEAFLKAWNSYLSIQENLERLRSICPSAEDQVRILEIEEELLVISKRVFRKLKAVRTL